MGTRRAEMLLSVLVVLVIMNNGGVSGIIFPFLRFSTNSIMVYLPLDKVRWSHTVQFTYLDFTSVGESDISSVDN